MNDQPSKIYLLPNLMTAGNLFCGFTATLKILEGALLQSSNADAANDLFHAAIWFILGAFVFDFLDGRLARLGGHESGFGREFDSLAESEHNLGKWRFVLPPLLLFLSFMMFSRFEYPSFKAINWKTKKSIPRFLVIFVVLVFTAINYEWMPAILFLAYLLYGFLRPWLSREWQREIEEEIGEEGSEDPTEEAS